MYIAIAGNIGSGKTTLTEMLTERYGAKAYYEQSDNPYIGDFYNDMNRWSFNLQMYFLGSRIQQTMDILRSGPVDIFQDRTVYEDAYIFADNLHRMGLMSGRDFDTYMSIFGLITNLVPRPDLLIYLKASVPTLISQIRRRGRAYEMNIDEQYLRRLNDRYDDWIENIYRGEVLVIDKDREDFVADAAVMEKICARLDRKREELETAKKIVPMLPESFTRRVMAELGPEEGRALCEALEGPAPTSVRLHPQRPCRWSGAEAVPWSPAGRYLTERPSFTLDPAFHAGAYYVQEASSQFLAHVLAGEEVAGKRILDLCAAPGGKTTLYASLAGSDGLVVANEVNRQRAAVLADNVRKWGLGNVAVTVNEPAQIAVLEGWFDIVAVDAPCSGEGMFRKIPEARDEWSENNVKICAVRQAEILREAWKTLRPGGLLIYSTCTFNRLENEGSLEGLLAEAGEEIVESTAFDCPPAWGVVCGRVGPFRTFRFYPHRTRGEGFFAAVARKVSDGGSRVRVPKSRRTIFAPAGRRECAELSRWVAEPERMRFAAVADVYYAYYESQYEAVKMLAESLRVIASGVAMGQIFKERLKPDHALAMFCGLDRGAVPVAELSEEEALRFLRKQEAEAAAFAEGMNLVTHGGAALGFAKRIQNRVNNMYPNSLRIFNL